MTNTLAILHPQEEKAWQFAFEFFLNEANDDAAADAMAWAELRNLFPRLAAFEGIAQEP